MKLYAKIWLAVVVTIAAFAMVVSLLWQSHTAQMREQFRNQAAEMSQREGQRDIEVRNEANQVVGHASRRVDNIPPAAAALSPDDLPMPPQSQLSQLPPLPPRTRGFDVRLDNGQTLSLIMPQRLPRPERRAPPWYFSTFGFFGLLGLMAFAVALGAYPVVRRLTRRLEALQQGVDQWGAGRLSARVPVEGTDEVAFLAQKFNHAAERVESLVKAHKSLLANASHELRSPLARIRMALALLQATSDKASEASAKLAHQEINQNISELDGLIEEILLASRLDAPDASLGPTESFDLMGLAAEECARTGAKLWVEDNSQGAFDMVGYPRLIRRLLRNLLENAQRYNDASKGPVTLSLTKDADLLNILVRDHGPGVAKDECNRIFEPFYRAKNASERDGGVGLGLALVKSIAERHKGSAACVPIKGLGGGFIVRLAVA
ncbi:MAG: HAMP domain-containing sensor histidine kinase [Cytophagales bacterium]|nr:HAMP domain-containing sensor histidine kinase [Cytophagales bacterium]